MAGRAEICSATDAFQGAGATGDVRKLEKQPAGSRSGPLAQQRAVSYDPKSIRGEVVLDCGAHIGQYTREALEARAKHIVAIEPSPDNLANPSLMAAIHSALRRKQKTLEFFHPTDTSVWDEVIE